MPFEFSSQWFPDVRAAIGLDVSEIVLDDTTLSSAVYKTETERFIERHLTEAQYDIAEWTDEAKYAAILYMASLAVASLRFVDSERLPAGNINYSKIDVEARASDLRNRATGRLGDILAATTASGIRDCIRRRLFH